MKRLTDSGSGALTLVSMIATAVLLSPTVARSQTPEWMMYIGLPSDVTGMGQSYYVAPYGDDRNPGTLAAAWKTIQKAANTLIPGDIVYVRGDVYNEQVTVNVSGSANEGYITFHNYENETPILDGTGLSVPAGNNGMFLIVDQHHIIIEGFEIRNYRTSTPHTVPVGIHIRGKAHHIQLKNNHIHHIETNAPVDDDRDGADAHGIAVYGTSAPESINNIFIDSNELHDLTLGSSEALVLNGNVELFTVTNNIVYDCDNIGIDLIGFEETAPDPDYDQARNGVVSNNVLMAGGLPLDRATLASIPSARRIIAKNALHRQSEDGRLYVDQDGCAAALHDAKQLAATDPRIEAYLIDDFSTGSIKAGAQPEHLARLQFINATEFPHLPLMGTVYEMSLEDERVWACLPYFAGFLSPLWHAADIDRLPGYVARIAELSGNKPQLACIYLFDFGNSQLLSYAQMQRQLDVAEGLLREERVVGVCILGTCMMDLEWEANRCLYDRLARVGDSAL